VPSQGTLWVVPADGTIVRTRLFVGGFTGPGSTATVDVRFARDTRLGLWLPQSMSERHEGMRQMRGGVTRTNIPTVVTATATYGEFKRFETSTSFTIKH
jgi:hypothetical protein